MSMLFLLARVITYKTVITLFNPEKFISPFDYYKNSTPE